MVKDISININWSDYGKCGKILYIVSTNCYMLNKNKIDRKIIYERMLKISNSIEAEDLKKININKDIFLNMKEDEPLERIKNKCKILLIYYKTCLMYDTNFVNDVLLHSIKLLQTQAGIGGSSQRHFDKGQ